MVQRNDYAGKRFGRLTVISYAGSNKFKAATWSCVCDCGNKTIVAGCSLANKDTQSCGCLLKEARKRVKNVTHGLIDHPMYESWHGMKQRCFNVNNKDYKHYGARGITICERWLLFKNFYDDMIISWQKGLSIDRINVNGNYKPSNCRWATAKEQARNKRKTLESNGG